MRNVIIIFLFSVSLASGQPAQTSPELRQAILDYQLTLPRANQLIAAMEAMTKYVVFSAEFPGSPAEVNDHDSGGASGAD